MSIQVDSSNPLQTLLVINGVSVLKLNQDGSVELPNAPVGTSGSRLLTANQTPFTKEYVSPEQVITSAGSLTLAHGLGVLPKLYRTSIICKTAEQNYSPGDVVEVGGFADVTDTGSFTKGVAIFSDSDNIGIRYVSSASAFQVINKTTGASAQVTNANWRLVVRAYA